MLWAQFPIQIYVCAQASCDPSCLAWDQAAETLAGAASIPGHVTADLELTDLASWLDLSPALSLWLAWQTTAPLAEPGCGHWPGSAPPAHAAQGHCPACFAATRGSEGKPQEVTLLPRYDPDTQGVLWATPESHQSNGPALLLPSLPVPGTKAKRLKKSKLRSVQKGTQLNETRKGIHYHPCVSSRIFCYRRFIFRMISGIKGINWGQRLIK